jgi:hypothetical protein
VLPSIVNEVTKAVVAKYNAAELLTKREQVSKAVSSKPCVLTSVVYVIMCCVCGQSVRYSCSVRLFSTGMIHSVAALSSEASAQSLWY